MAKSSNQKLKLLYLMRIFMEKTDEEHSLTLAEIIQQLSAYEVSADRKTLYLDFEELRRFGLDIISEQCGKTVVYRLASREFELAELKLLVDSVQAAKFVTEKKSAALIKKLESLVSENEAKQLQRQVLISGRIKTMNESIYYNVDKIHTAIAEGKQITYHYFQWTPDKETELRHGGKLYQVSPWYLACNDGNYYLIAYEAETDIIKHFRVDKMLNIMLLENPREGREKLNAMDIAAYSKRLFGMHGGETVRVTLECKNELAGVIIDRFGKDVVMFRKDQNSFITHVQVVASVQFLGWIVGLGDGVKIIAPEDIVSRMRNLVQRLVADYM